MASHHPHHPTNATTHALPFAGTRIVVHSAHDFNTTMSRLYAEIGSPTTLKFPAIAKGITSYDASARDAFTAGVLDAVGEYGFMLFLEIDHAAWLPLFQLSLSPTTGKPLALKRLILGNPLTAKTMIQHDLTAGLFVPVELLVREKAQEEEGGGTELTYVLPSSLIVGIYEAGKAGGKEGRRELSQEKVRLLGEAARALDAKLAKMIESVAT